MKIYFTILLNLFVQFICAQNKIGIISGNILDEKRNPVEKASIQLTLLKDSSNSFFTISDKNGNFIFQNIRFGYYRLTITTVNSTRTIIDSIFLREDRSDFNIIDIVLKSKSEILQEVIVYVEKPLFENKDGNITFNVGESALSAGSTTSELLQNTPLVSKDPSGKLLVRGKEPKILIDEKPVELNAQQLQDLLESMNGSMIEKIEVMPNPPPQYANEPGGVINIVTKKGKSGSNARITGSSGTRGEYGLNGNYTFRQKGMNLSINGGYNYSQLKGSSNAQRENYYTDSSNYLNSNSNFINKNKRPSFRINFDKDINTTNSINVSLQFNRNNFANQTNSEFNNINNSKTLYRITKRQIDSRGYNINYNVSVSYTLKGKRKGALIRLITNIAKTTSNSNRNFFQQYLNSDYSTNGFDSTQQQINSATHKSFIIRFNLEQPFFNYKTFLSAGLLYNASVQNPLSEVYYFKRPENFFIYDNSLSNDLRFGQNIFSHFFSLKQLLGKEISITGGVNIDYTHVEFDLYRTQANASNFYYSILPFGNFNKRWKNNFSFTFSYRKTIRRPNINELNPVVDFSDPYNIRFGNINLKATTSHVLDWVVGKSGNAFFINLGIGYNKVNDIISAVRNLLPDGKTQISMQNISSRKEYESSLWGGFTFIKKLRINFNTGYTYNVYNNYDNLSNKFTNGGSFNSALNFVFTPNSLCNVTCNVGYNRFANPQGNTRSNISNTIAIQYKLYNKKVILTLHAIDPFRQQKNQSITRGLNFLVENENLTQTRNIRLTVAWNFENPGKTKFNLKK